MSKICRILFVIFILSLGILIYSPQKGFADNCTYTFDPTPNIDMQDLKVTISSKDIASGIYKGEMKPPSNANYYLKYDNIKFENGEATFTIDRPATNGWEAGENKFRLFKGYPATEFFCQKSINILSAPSQACVLTPEDPQLDPTKNVVMVVNGITPSTCSLNNFWGGYDVYVNGIHKDIYCTEIGNKISLGTFPTGDYTVEIKSRCYIPFCTPRLICNPAPFKVNPIGTAPDTTGPSCDISPPPPRTTLSNIYITASKLLPDTKYRAEREKDSSRVVTARDISSDRYGNIVLSLDYPIGEKTPVGHYTAYIYGNNDQFVCQKPYTVEDNAGRVTSCTENCSFGGGKEVPGCTDDAKNPGIATAIGCIHTNPAELVKDLMTWIIGIGGGIAFLMMLLGAFQMLTSAGNPETLNAGKDRLTSAVIGLLMVIFAVLLLQIIGWGILKIPGFG